MSVKIKKINIQAFRGIRDWELELQSKSLLLRGENGSGKSSMVEAIEFFHTGEVSCLEGTRGLSLQRHGPHVKCTPDDVSVQITFDPGNVSLCRTLTSAPSPPALLESYWKATQKGRFILRRSQILEFIISQPADRFRVIGGIIGIEALDNVELEMMRLRDDLEGGVRSKEQKSGTLLRDLSKLVGKDITGINDVLPALNEILQEAKLPLITSLEKVDAHAKEMLATVRKSGGVDNVGVLNELVKMTSAPLISQEIIDELASVNEKLQYLLNDKARVELSVAALLESGGQVIEQEAMDICPLCEQEIRREELLARIDQRLTILQGLSDKASEIRTACVPAMDKLTELSGKLKSMILRIESFGELSEEKDALSGKLEFFNEFISKVASAKELKNEIPTSQISREKDSINNIVTSVSTKCTQLLSNIGLTDEEMKVLEAVRLIEQARNKADSILEVNSLLKADKKYWELADKIYCAFSDVKKAKIQEIYDTIQEDIQGFYSILHPDEPHKNPELIVALGRRASTEMQMESFGRKGEDPRALTSEGHLDSLGLCIFLAFVKKFCKDCPLIVLDDVVTAIDARHRGNICRLLLEEFQEKQLVITTHDEVWYEQLCASQRAYGVEGNFKNLMIVDWNVDTGPVIRPYKVRWERIQEKIAGGDKTGAGNEGRQYLEWVLEKICQVTVAFVPFKSPPRYEVGELLTSAKKRLDDLINDDVFEARTSQAFQDLTQTVIMGNLLSHNSILADKVSIDEAHSFCKAVRELHNVFLCPGCGHLMDYYRQLKRLRCSNPRCNNPTEVKTN